LNSESIRWAFGAHDYPQRYIPLGYLGFDCIFAWGGLHASSYHLVGVLLLSLDALLLYILLGRLLALLTPGLPGRSCTIELSAGGAALLWALHPTRAECVAWISGLIYLLAAAFALAAFICHSHALSLRLPGRASRVWRVAAAFFYLASVITYPVFLSFSAIAVVLEYSVLYRDSANPWLHKLGACLRDGTPWLLASLFSGALNLFATFGAQSVDSPAFRLHKFALGARSLQATAVSAELIGRTFYFDFASLYRGAPLDIDSHLWTWIATGLFVVCMALLAYARPAWRVSIGAIGFCSIFAIAPASGFFQRDWHASDRYTITLHMVLAIVPGLLICHWSTSRARVLSFAIVASLIILCIPSYLKATAIWQNVDTLQSSIDRSFPAEAGANKHLASRSAIIALCYCRPAMAEFCLGKPDGAKARIGAGLKRFPANPAILQTQADIANLQKSIAVPGGTPAFVPFYAIMHLDMARQLYKAGRKFAAAAHLECALQLSPALGTSLPGARTDLPRVNSK
jgi:hypothetical protein